MSGVALLDLAKDPGVVARSARKIDAGQFHDVACARERRVDAGTVAFLHQEQQREAGQRYIMMPAGSAAHFIAGHAEPP